VAHGLLQEPKVGAGPARQRGLDVPEIVHTQRWAADLEIAWRHFTDGFQFSSLRRDPSGFARGGAVLSSWRTIFFLTFVSRKWRIFSRPLCSGSSPRHFQQDLAATELMRHRVLDVLEGVHARYRNHEGAVGY
jgi:hypothetical protein